MVLAESIRPSRRTLVPASASGLPGITFAGTLPGGLVPECLQQVPAPYNGIFVVDYAR